MPTVDPAGDELLNIANLHFKKRQAELDLEQAQTQLNHAGRTAVPRVFAELVAQKQKEDKRKEAIQKAGAQQAPSPESMLPPLTEVTGQTRGTEGASIASNIAEMVSGGRAVKMQQQQPIGVVSGQFPPQAQAQGVPAAAPNEPIPIERKVSGVERALSVPGLLLSAAGRNPEAIVHFGKQLFTGKETVGYTTAEEQAAQHQAQERARIDPLAKPLSVLRLQMESDDPAVQQQAQQSFQQHLDQIEQNLGPEDRAAVASRADDLYLIASEKRFEKQLDPAYQNKLALDRQKFDVRNKALTCGYECLSEAEKVIMGGRQKLEVSGSLLTAPTQATKNFGQREVMQNDVLINSLNQVSEALTNPDGTIWEEPFTLAGKARFANMEARDYLRGMHPQGPLDDTERKEFDRFSTIKQNLAMLNVPYMHQLIGATMSPAELQRIDDLLAQINKAPIPNIVALRELRQTMGLNKVRYLTILNTPEFQGMDPETAQPLSNTKEMVRQMVAKKAEEFSAQGVPKEQAEQRIQAMFYNAYGLDIKKMFGQKQTE